MLWDRQGSFGPEFPALQQWLNSGAISEARKAAALAAKRYQLTPDGENTVVLFRDPLGLIAGTPNRAYGYLYVAAWLHNNEPDKQIAAEVVRSQSVDANTKLRKRASRVNEMVKRSRNG
jgi:hypothetical protein